jgi:hypothetical protein
MVQQGSYWHGGIIVSVQKRRLTGTDILPQKIDQGSYLRIGECRSRSRGRSRGRDLDREGRRSGSRGGDGSGSGDSRNLFRCDLEHKRLFTGKYRSLVSRGRSSKYSVPRGSSTEFNVRQSKLF